MLSPIPFPLDYSGDQAPAPANEDSERVLVDMQELRVEEVVDSGCLRVHIESALDVERGGADGASLKDLFSRV